MLKNYLVTILRQIKKNKVFSLINILGLSLGMAACLVIAQYVRFHSSFDDFHSDTDRIYRIENYASQNGTDLGKGATAPDPMTEELLENSRHIEALAKFYPYNYANNSIIYKNGDEKVSFEQSGVFVANSGVFDVFNLNFIAGGTNKFEEPQKAILVKSASVKYFQDPEAAIGSTFTLSGNNGPHEYELVGILEDLPDNSHIQFELLLSYPSIDNYTSARRSWGYNSMVTYFRLGNSSTPSEVLADVNRLHEENAKELLSQSGFTVDYELVQLKDVYLGDNSPSIFIQSVNGSTLLILGSIAMIILVIAWINYMNLSLIRTMERLKEMGIRKCMGSSLKQLTQLFVLEAFIMNMIAFSLAILLTQFGEKYLIEVTGLPISALMNQEMMLLLGGLILAGTLLIGFYPFALLRAMNIVNVLVGHKGKVGGTRMRKSLVFVQFVITFILIAGTLTIYNQIDYMRDADLGIEIENILVIKSPPGDVGSDKREDLTRLNTFKTELLKQTGIAGITNAGEIPGEMVSWGANLYLKNGSSETSVYSGLISMDLDFPQFFGIDLVAGRELRKGDSPWTKGDAVINVKLAEQLGFANPEEALGVELEGFYGSVPLKVQGVVENHHHTSLHDDYQPLAYILSTWTEFYFVKLRLDEENPELKSEQMAGLISVVEQEWNNAFTDYQMDYFFLDRAFDEQYKEDIRFGKIFTGFSSLAIFIACLGLFGLMSFTVQQRTKEIGIRKVLGATASNLMVLLSKEYLMLIGVACLVSIPVAWYVMNNWLQSYTFQIELGWWFFIIPVAFVVGMALLSIVTKIMGTVKMNPIQSLRYE